MRALLCAAALALLVAGCGGGNDGAAKGDGAAKAGDLTATTPAAGGQLDSIKWALPYGEPTTLDPIKTGDYSPNTVLMNVCEGLMRVQPDYSIVPGLAERVDHTGDRELVYHLHPGVKFSDGTPLTAKAVVASLMRNTDPKLGGIGGVFFESVKSITASGPLAVTVKFSKPDEVFNQAMSTEIGAITEPSAAKAAGKDYGTAAHPPVCTGPYKVASWDSGQSITLERNDGYWDPKLKPKVKTVAFRFITDSSTLTSALLSGDVDGAYEAPLSSLSTLEKTDAGELYLGPSSQVFLFGPANPQTPMAKPELRKALNAAIDRRALVRNVFHDAAVPNRALIPSTAFGQGAGKATLQAGYDALPDNTAPDMAAAKKLLAGAGGAPAQTMTIGLPAGDQSELQLATFVQASGKAIGLEFKLRQMPATAFSSLFYDASKRKDIDLVLAAGYLEIPDPLSYAVLFLPKDALFNWTAYDQPEVSALLAQSQRELDPKASAEAFVKAQAAYERDLPVIPIASPCERLFMNKRISGAPAAFTYINMPWAAMIGGTGK